MRPIQGNYTITTDAEEPVFIHGSLKRHVSVMSFTASIGLMSIFAVDFVDMIFIGMLGNAALAAAVGYAGTVLFFTTSIAIGFSIAAGSLVARALGAREAQEAREYASSVLLIGVVLAVFIAAAVFTYAPVLIQLLGATGETHELATRFLRIIVPSMPVMVIAMVCSAVLRAHGDAKRAMYATLAAGVVNAIIDPILIFGFKLGLDGAALASVIARFTMLYVAVMPVIKKYDGLAMPTKDSLRRDLAPVANIATPAVLANVATPVGAALVTREMARYGTDAVAGMAIIGRLTPLAFAVLFALSGAVGPIIGQNFGARLFDRVRGTFSAAMQFIFVYVVFVSLLLYLLRAPIAAAFDASGQTLMLLTLFCGPLALVYFFNGIIFVGNATFNNLGHASYSTYINWGKNTIGTWPFIIAGAYLGGAAGILIGQAAGSVLFAIISLWLSKKVMDNQDPDKPKNPFEPHRRFHILHSRSH